MAPKTPPKKLNLKKPVVRRSSQAASKKPVFSMGTLITLVVFAAVVLGIILINRQKETSAAEATPVESEPVTFIFGESDGVLSGIEVKPNEGEAVKLVRDDKNVWAFELPEKVEADQGYMEQVASQVSALRVVQTLPENASPSTFGFDAPAYVITLKFGADKERVLEVGDSAPSGNGYYVRVDKGGIKLVDLNGIGALTQLVDFPPYLYTPTPEPTATEVPATSTLTAPTGETTVTPEAGVTPGGETPTPEAGVTPTGETPTPETSVTPTP